MEKTTQDKIDKLASLLNEAKDLYYELVEIPEADEVLKESYDDIETAMSLV